MKLIESSIDDWDFSVYDGYGFFGGRTLIYIDMNGRCGNQFFQYAFARKLSMMNGNMPMQIDFHNVERWRRKTGFDSYRNELSDFCTIPFQAVMESGDSLSAYGTEHQKRIRRMYAKIRAAQTHLKKLRLADKWQDYMQKHGVYRDDEFVIIPQKCKSEDIFVRGYFEDPSYFADMRDLLIREFTPKQPPKEKNKALYTIIEERESVCVSFRVWNDIQDDKKELNARDVCSQQYYTEAVAKMKELHPNACFIVFSNNIEWVRKNFDFPGDVYYEEGSDEVWEKIRMMYSCKHFIMSTSTFCWWAQYLCRNEQKSVIAPDRWTNDDDRVCRLMEDSWIRIKA